jgi:hypothetical protein
VQRLHSVRRCVRTKGESRLDTKVHDYFALPHSSAAGSPVGVLMVKMLENHSALTFDAARAEARRLLGKAAGRFHYTPPRVLSAAHRAEQKNRLRSRFTGTKTSEAAALAFPTPTSTSQTAGMGTTSGAEEAPIDRCA